MKSSNDIDSLQIGKTVGAVRRRQGWTQALLAEELGISQGRLSELERGLGSFSAEQFLRMLSLFHLTPADFVGPQSPQAALQDAVSRLGGSDLIESKDSLPTESLKEVNRVIEEVLIEGTPRLLVSLASVLVHNIDSVNLRALYAKLQAAGLERRLAWFLENTRAGLKKELRRSPPRSAAIKYKRAELVLDLFSEFLTTRKDLETSQLVDILEKTIRTKKTLKTVLENSSKISERYGIAVRIHPEDFSRNLQVNVG